jgi:hypothetical protein
VSVVARSVPSITAVHSACHEQRSTMVNSGLQQRIAHDGKSTKKPADLGKG